MRTILNEQLLTEILISETRLSSETLYEMLLSSARVAMVSNNRCALISSIASVLSNIGEDDDAVNDFIRLQIDREIDCGCCTRCNLSIAETDA
jgi:hypothetical protein